jgi:pantoate--beta-alanine ligase
MRIDADPRAVRAHLDQLRAQGRSVGFMPTLGYMHEGHAANIRAARAACDVVVVSIFLNPTQFGPGEDLDRYPRDDARDEAICETEGVDLVFRPAVAAMYDDGPRFQIDTGTMGTRLCGATRPGHFNGVATVVAKLFNIVGPCRGYFGEKDAQQLVILERLVEAFDVPVEIVRCPTIREPDGLALSSRNVYLSPEDRRAALVLSRSLFESRDRILDGERDARAIVKGMRSRIGEEPRAEIDYVAAVDPRTLEDLTRIERSALLAVAVGFGDTRLIDNVSVAL